MPSGCGGAGAAGVSGSGAAGASGSGAAACATHSPILLRTQFCGTVWHIPVVTVTVVAPSDASALLLNFRDHPTTPGWNAALTVAFFGNRYVLL